MNELAETQIGNGGEKLNEPLLSQNKRMPDIDGDLNSAVSHNVDNIKSACADIRDAGERVGRIEEFAQPCVKLLSKDGVAVASAQGSPSDFLSKVNGPVDKYLCKLDGPLKERVDMNGLLSKENFKRAEACDEAVVKCSAKEESKSVLEYSSSTPVSSRQSSKNKNKEACSSGTLT